MSPQSRKLKTRQKKSSNPMAAAIETANGVRVSGTSNPRASQQRVSGSAASSLPYPLVDKAKILDEVANIDEVAKIMERREKDSSTVPINLPKQSIKALFVGPFVLDKVLKDAGHYIGTKSGPMKDKIVSESMTHGLVPLEWKEMKKGPKMKTIAAGSSPSQTTKLSNTRRSAVSWRCNKTSSSCGPAKRFRFKAPRSSFNP